MNKSQPVIQSLLGVTIFLIGFNTGIAQDTEEQSTDNHHCFFRPGSVMGGLGLPYTSQLRSFGINGRTYYNVNHNLCFGPEIAYFNSSQEKLWDVDLVVHYIIETPWLGLYPVAGINYSKELRHSQETTSAVGALFGAGVHRNIHKLTIFSEYTYLASKLGDQFVTMGFLYQIR